MDLNDRLKAIRMVEAFEEDESKLVKKFKKLFEEHPEITKDD